MTATRHWQITSADGARGRALIALGAVVLLGITLVVAWRAAQPGTRTFTNPPPPPDGYFRLLPVGSYASLPDDRRAAAKVHYSAWEPRSANSRYNHTSAIHVKIQREKAATKAFDPRWNKYILGRITGHFTGTTDEIFQ